MSCYQINGGTPLRGRLAVQGAKNSVLPILAAALLAPGERVIHNCPDLSDVTATLDILRLLGCGVSREGDTVALDARELDGTVIPASLMGELRSSVIFLGALLTRMGEVELSYPGGCELGPRPIDLHLGALRQLGAEIREEGGFLHCRAPRGAASCAGGERRCGGGSCASPCPAWGPQRTSCWPPVAVLAGPLWWGPPRSRRS